MACQFLSFNGESHSELAYYLNDNINNGDEKLTNEQMNYFRSKEFIEEFGDYIKGRKNLYEGQDEMMDRVNEIGEPKLRFDKEAQKHYFLNKDNQRVFYPISKKELRSILTYEDINRVSSRLALTYFKKSKIDFNNIDFESGEKLPDLNSFIKSEIDNKIKSSDESGDFATSVVVEPLKDYIEELTVEVEGFFKRMSLKTIADENTLNEDEIGEDVKDAGFGLNSFERDSKASVSTNVKLRLSLLEDKTNLDPIWNEPTFKKFDEVYSDLITVLTDIVDLPGEDVWDLYKENISRIIGKKPYLQDVYDYITSDGFNNYKQNEFIQAFRLHKNNHQISQSIAEVVETKDKDGNMITTTVLYYKTMGISDSGNKTTLVLENWFDNFRSTFLNADNTIQEDSIERLSKLNDGFKTLVAKYNKLKDNYTVQGEEEIVNNYIKGLTTLGINISKDGFENFLDNYNQDISEEKRITKITEALYRTQLGVDSIIKTYSNKPGEAKFENPFQKASYLFRTFAQNEAFFIPEGSDSTVISGGKQKWIYSYPSYLSTKIKQWKKNPMLLVELLNASEYNKGSYLLQYLTGEINENGIPSGLTADEKLTLSTQRLQNFDLGIFNQMQANDEFKATTDLSFKDYITDHVNKVLLNDFKRTITQADKTTEYQIKTGLNVTGFDGMSRDTDGKAIILVSDPAKKMFFNYFASEYNRMIEADNDVEQAIRNKTTNKLTIHYHFKAGSNPTAKNGNAFQSQYFERLSNNATNLTDREKVIHDLLYNNPNKTRLVYSENQELTLALENYIETELLKGIQQTYQNLIANDIIQLTEDNKSILNNLDQSVVDKYNKFNKNNIHGAALAVATDYYLNSVHNAIEYTKMFTGDMAYYKNPVDFKKRIPATYTDGLQLRVEPGQEYFTIATIESVYRTSPFYDKLVANLGVNGAKPYSNINSADAQAWITPKRWKFLIQGLGKWTKAHDGIYKKMTSETPEPYTEKELKIAAQPLKGVYFYRDTTGKPVYLKYSQAVLSKALVTGSDLESLFDKMDNDNIDEVITLDGVKVGASVSTKIHDDNGQMLKDFTLNKQQLYNRGWKLQQDLPTKTYKDTDVGSQIQKNIFAGIIHRLQDNNFDLNGEKVTGQEILNQIVSTVRDMSNEGLANIKKEFGINDESEIKNIRGFYKSLIKELESRNGSQNVIDALNAEIALPGIPQAGSKLINIFASIMTDRLIKIKTNGGSFIQMSNFGMNKTEGNEQGVMWAPDADSTTNEPYLDPETLKFTPGGVLISGSFLKDIPNWRQMDPKDLFGYTNEKGEFIEGIIDREILENIIGYRIPNQGLASNDSLWCAGILPESSGDTVVAYTGITTKTGSDFDVDKMYIMFPKSKLTNGKLVYDEKDNGNKLIELYKAVLSHPEVHKDVMKPIDIDFINNEINSLFKDGKLPTLYHFDPFEDVKLRYLFLGGKAGVGQEANAMVDISRTGELSFNDTYIGWGHSNELGETKLDNEYSIQLSETDMKYYIDLMKPKDEAAFRAELSKVRIGDSLTAILNGFVDIAKDPVLPKGNWVTATTNVGNLMLRAGVHPLYVVDFMAQPIIREYVDFQKSIEGLTTNNSGDTDYKFKKDMVINSLNKIDNKYGLAYQRVFRDLNNTYKRDLLQQQLDGGLRQVTYDAEIAKLDKAEKQALKKLTDSFGSVNVEQVRKILTSEHDKVFQPEPVNLIQQDLKDFREQITKSRNNNFQLAVLNKFKELQDLSKKVGENIIVSKVDTNGMGKNINSLYALINLKQVIINKQDNEGALKGFESKFVNSPLEVYFNQMKEIVKIVDANPVLFPQGQVQVQDMFNEISYDLYSQPAVNQEMMSDLEVSYNSYLMSNFFKLSEEETTDLLKNLPKRFKEFKDKNKGKYFMLEELNIKDPKKKGDLSLIGLNNRKKSSTYEKEFTDSWKDLMINNPKLANDLVKYSFVTSGFKMNSTQFFTYIPYTYFQSNSINNFVSNFREQQQADFIDLFYRNNLENKKYVPKMDDKRMKYFPASNAVKAFDKKDGLVVESQLRKAKYYIEYADNFYKLEGYIAVKRNNKVIGYRPLYLAVNPAFNKVNGNNIPNYNYTSNEYKLSAEDIQSIKDRYELIDRNVDVYNMDFQQDVINESVAEEQIEVSNAQDLWNEYESRILAKYPNETIEYLEMLIDDMGDIKKVEEYLKKCY